MSAHYVETTLRVFAKFGRELGAWRKRAQERKQLSLMTEVERHDIEITSTEFGWKSAIRVGDDDSSVERLYEYPSNGRAPLLL